MGHILSQKPNQDLNLIVLAFGVTKLMKSYLTNNDKFKLFNTSVEKKSRNL